MRVPRTETKKARIEIIPMIDVIFFLLVFFMMTSLTMVQMEGERVTLPESATATLNPEEKVVVSIAKSGQVFVGRDQVNEAQVLPLISEQVKANPAITVIINCDKEQQMTRFVRVFDLIKQANAGKVMIATSPKNAMEAVGNAAAEH